MLNRQSIRSGHNANTFPPRLKLASLFVSAALVVSVLLNVATTAAGIVT